MAKRKSRKIVLSSLASEVIIGGKKPVVTIIDNGDGTYTWGTYKGPLVALCLSSYFEKANTTITTPDNVMDIIRDGLTYHISDLYVADFGG